MTPFQTSAGFEITDTDLCVAVVQSTFGGFRLQHNEKVPGFTELSEAAQRDCLERLARKYSLQRMKVFLAVPRAMGICRRLELPAEAADRAASAAALQIESLSPWTAEEVYWDYAIDKSARAAKSVDLLIGLVPRSVLDPWLELFRSSGILLSGATLVSAALSHSLVLTNPQSSKHAWELLSPRGSEESRTDTKIDLKIAGWAPSGEGAAAIATALTGFGSSVFNLNLIPVAERFRRQHLRLVPTYVLLGAILVLGVIYVTREPYQWRLYGETLDSQIETLKPSIDEVSAKEVALNQAKTAYEALRTRVEDRDFNLEALREIARVLPADGWISSYASQGRAVTLSGFAQSASAVQKALEESPVFEGVQFTAPVTRDASGKDRFSIKATAGVAP